MRTNLACGVRERKENVLEGGQATSNDTLVSFHQNTATIGNLKWMREAGVST